MVEIKPDGGKITYYVGVRKEDGEICILGSFNDEEPVFCATLAEISELVEEVDAEEAASDFERSFLNSEPISFSAEIDMLGSDFLKLIGCKGAAPGRKGFKPHRKKWESSKDDPSTFGAYMHNRRRKKR